MAKKPDELADCQQRLSAALDVLENIKYAADNGDWDILDAAAKGAERELKRIGELIDRTRRECENRDPHIMRMVNVVLTEEGLTLAEPVEAA